MIDNTIKVVARVTLNIEEECHEWFEDAFRLADKIGATVSAPRITGRQVHRNNAHAHALFYYLKFLVSKYKLLPLIIIIIIMMMMMMINIS